MVPSGVIDILWSLLYEKYPVDVGATYWKEQTDDAQAKETSAHLCDSAIVDLISVSILRQTE